MDKRSTRAIVRLVVLVVCCIGLAASVISDGGRALDTICLVIGGFLVGANMSIVADLNNSHKELEKSFAVLKQLYIRECEEASKLEEELEKMYKAAGRDRLKEMVDELSD